MERYCKDCGYEVLNEGDVGTLYEGKLFCDCKNGNKHGERVFLSPGRKIDNPKQEPLVRFDLELAKKTMTAQMRNGRKVKLTYFSKELMLGEFEDDGAESSWFLDGRDPEIGYDTCLVNAPAEKKYDEKLVDTISDFLCCHFGEECESAETYNKEAQRIIDIIEKHNGAKKE